MKLEQTFILEICKFKDFNRDKVLGLMEKSLDYPYILGQLLYNRMGGIAYYTLKEYSLLSKLNREFRNTLMTVYDNNVIKTESFVFALDELCGILKNSDFNYAILKGGYLVSLYPKGLRTSNDFDILVNQEDVTKISELLKKNGYLQGYIRNGQFIPASRTEIVASRMNRGETVPFVKKVNFPQMEYCEIDINFSLGFKAKGENDVVKNLLSKSEKRIKTKCGEMSTLASADFLIHLCMHLYKEATVINWVEMGRDLSLYKFSDIYLFISEFMNDDLYNNLIFSISEYGFQKECYYAFSYTRDLYDIKNAQFNKLIQVIRPNNINYLNKIISPSDGKTYQYDLNFNEWIFYPLRKERLYEVRNEK